jgi:hypothetical protein
MSQVSNNTLQLASAYTSYPTLYQTKLLYPAPKCNTIYETEMCSTMAAINYDYCVVDKSTSHRFIEVLPYSSSGQSQTQTQTQTLTSQHVLSRSLRFLEPLLSGSWSAGPRSVAGLERHDALSEGMQLLQCRCRSLTAICRCRYTVYARH